MAINDVCPRCLRGFEPLDAHSLTRCDWVRKRINTLMVPFLVLSVHPGWFRA